MRRLTTDEKIESSMRKLRHHYSNVYYSDLDKPVQELENLEKFLKKYVNLNKLALVSVNPLSKDILISNYDGDIKSLIDYVFIRSDLAGAGNYNFIIEYKEILQSERIIHTTTKHLVKKLFRNRFFDNKWIEELINEDIVCSVMITYCDGIWVELFKK